MVNAPEVLAIIPARGGSQGIPGKNLRPLALHPLLAWSIAAGQQAQTVTRVIVSTDSDEIARTALFYGAEVPFIRPASLAEHDTRDLPVFEHALEWLEKNEGYKPEVVVQLRPTSPLRPRCLVDEAVERLLSDDEADSVRSVTSPSQNPYKMWSVAEGELKPLVPCGIYEPYNAPRQLLPETYWQTGHIDVFRRRTLQQKSSLTGDRILPVFVDPQCAIDIDSLMHLRMAAEILEEGNLGLVSPSLADSGLLRSIRLFVFDFDGVFTDNQVYVDENGAESVRCSRADGLGVSRLLDHGFEAAVLSTETNPVVLARCRKLKIPVQQGVQDKARALRELAASRGLGLDQVAFVGNDVNDLECLRAAGAALVPADAHDSVRSVADLVLRSRGGHDAVREVCELAISALDRKKEAYASGSNR